MNLLNMFNQFKMNPMAMLQQRFQIPTNITQPDQIIQHLLNTGQVTQQQVNHAMGMRDNPMIQQFFRK